MAQLFGKGTIKENVSVLSGFDESKIAIVQRIHQDQKNKLLDDESRYEQTFNQLFFGDLLGYEDRINRVPKGGILNSGIADLTIGIFQDGKYDPEQIQVVCELKGAKSNLVKKQFGHGGLSPVGQGFAYKTGLKSCKWLIVSNFYEIRLYKDNQTDFEVWNLDELLDPTDNYFNLRKLYLLLNKNNLLSTTGTSKTEHLLSYFREQQKEITAKFYKEYKTLRIELINDIKHNNPSVNITTIIEKTQKIIDRLIFIFFCEDKGLLPDKKLKENIVRSREAGFSAWEVTRKFFNLIDKGSEQLGIPHGYNGGLFQPDDVLNILEVSDTVCKRFVDLTNYDFDDKLSVNVLGHIFEQSISDLENLKIDLLGHETETDQLVDTGKGRRKKDGIFYTPEYIVDYIVQNSVMRYLGEKEDACLVKYKKDEIKAYQAYQQVLQNIKVLDPACGSGAFLVRVFDVLLEENKRVGSILNSLFDETETYKNILTNNIYGVDLNEESVEITKLSLWLKSAQKGKKLNNLDANIKCGNSLIDDPAVAGDKAFDWSEEFKTIMGNGGFDVVVGNPPYVQTKNEKTNYNNYQTNPCGDLYALFYEKAISLIKTNGLLGFITPSLFLKGVKYISLREFLLKNTNILETIDHGDGIFEAVQMPTLTIILKKEKIKNQSMSQENKIIEKINIQCKNIGEISNIMRGLEIGKDKLTNSGIIIIVGEDIERYLIKNISYISAETYENFKKKINFFEGERILIRETGNTLTSIAIKDSIQNNRSLYSIKLNSGYNYFYVLSLLNSSLLQYYYSNKFRANTGIFPKIRIIQVKELPIKEISLDDQQPFIERADTMLLLNKNLHGHLTNKFINRIQDNLKITKLTKKLESFYDGDFKDFLDELKKQKITLTLSQQDEWEPYFKEYKEKILVLKGEIERTDKEIDEMVFDLYGLNEEERKVVLGG